MSNGEKKNKKESSGLGRSGFSFKFTLRNIKLKSSWFDFNFEEDGWESRVGNGSSNNNVSASQENTFKKMGLQGFVLFVNLFKFKLHGYGKDVFLTSVGLLRKETGYSKYVVFDLLKRLVKLGIIEFVNIKKLEQIIEVDSKRKWVKDGKGRYKIKENEVLCIRSLDAPQVEKGEDGKEMPVGMDDYYIPVSLEVFEEYERIGLGVECWPVYCLLQKLSNVTGEQKSFMSVNKMAKILGYGDGTLYRIIVEMNRRYVLYSRIRGKNKDRINGYFEHRLGSNMKKIEEIRSGLREEVDKFLREVDKREKKREIEKERYAAKDVEEFDWGGEDVPGFE